MNSQWTSYGLLAYVAKRLREKGLPLGKTKLQKLIFLLKELKDIDAGYRFHFYTYGPFSNSLAGDIDYLEHIKGLKVLLGESTESFIIEPGETAPIIVEKAREYLEPHKDDIDSVLEQFGGKLARELELLSTVIYVAHYDPEFRPGDQSYLIRKTKELKQKFPEAAIESGVNELADLDYVVA